MHLQLIITHAIRLPFPLPKFELASLQKLSRGHEGHSLSFVLENQTDQLGVDAFVVLDYLALNELGKGLPDLVDFRHVFVHCKLSIDLLVLRQYL